MAQWKQTLEPYVKVIETVKQVATNPTAGTDLIIGAVLISDAGPSTPTLISSQKEFLSTFAAQEISQDYTDSLNELYTGDNKTLASTMWLNAYRLAGAGTLLVSRASKTEGLIYAKPLSKTDAHDYILKDTDILRACSPFKFVIDNGNVLGQDVAEVTGANDGWAISIKDIGVIGNRVNDNGPLYDYYVDNLYDLVQKLNETTKFFSPDYKFYTDVTCSEDSEIELDDDSTDTDKASAIAVKFNVVYLAGDGIMEPEVTDAEGNVEYWGYDSAGPDGDLLEKETTHKNNWGDNDLHYTNPETGESESHADTDSTAVGCAYIIPATLDWDSSAQSVINLNSKNYSGFEVPDFYASNLYNSRVDLQVRIRRFNHNAVQQYTTEEGSSDSPYTVLTSVLDVYTKDKTTGKVGAVEPSDSILYYDFYEFAIKDPGVSEDWQLFNVGNIGGRGDISITDLNESLEMLHLTLPQDLHELGLNYYGYGSDDRWLKLSASPAYTDKGTLTLTGTNTIDDELKSLKATANEGDYYLYDSKYYLFQFNSWVISTEVPGGEDSVTYTDKGNIATLRKLYNHSNSASTGDYYKLGNNYYVFSDNGEEEISVNVKIGDSDNTDALLKASNGDIMKAWDRIEEDERYIVEGMTDLGCTESIIQNYMANIAVNSNYFYAASTVNSTNYMVIANKKAKIVNDSKKVYFLSPWDYDDGTVGYLFNCSPSVIYWEVVFKNRSNNNEFAAAFGQNTGVVTIVNLAKDFKKKERQLLLTKKINTVFHDLYLERYYINDNYTNQTDDDVMKEECNSRLMVRISKAMPVLLNQFKGRQNNAKTRESVCDVINYWFKTTVMAYGTTISDWLVTCDSTNNTDEDARANKLNVRVDVRYLNSIKYITVYHNAYPIGLDFGE